nr:serine hydrolase domain-containing protein [Pseudoalteromonas luteoviolacea]
MLFQGGAVVKILIGLIAFWTVIGCSQTVNGLQQKLEQQVVNNAAVHGIPAQAVLVNKNGKVIFKFATNSPSSRLPQTLDEHSVFPIFSVSKLFANVLVYQLLERGELNLEDNIGDYLNLPQQWQKIPLRALLNHTSGIPEYFTMTDGQVVAPKTIEEVIIAFQDQQPTSQPNEKIAYTQTNYLLIKLLLEAITAQSYETLVEERIFHPLQMSNTYLHGRSDTSNSVASYLPNGGQDLVANQYVFPTYGNSHTGAYSTTHDLNSFLSGLMSGKLVNVTLLRELWQQNKLTNGDMNYFSSGWHVEKMGPWQSVGHDGGALLRVTAMLNQRSGEYMLFIYLTNGNLDGVWSNRLIGSLQQHVLPDTFSRLIAWARYKDWFIF